MSAPSGGGQAMPTYAAKVDVDAFTRETTELVEQADGSMIQVTLTIWVPGSESTIPKRGDRITYEGDTYIVELEKPVENLRSELDHVKLMCRES